MAEELIGHDAPVPSRAVGQVRPARDGRRAIAACPAPLRPGGWKTPIVSSSQRGCIVSSLPRSKFNSRFTMGELKVLSRFPQSTAISTDSEKRETLRKNAFVSASCWRPRGWICLRWRLICTICCCSCCCCCWCCSSSVFFLPFFFFPRNCLGLKLLELRRHALSCVLTYMYTVYIHNTWPGREVSHSLGEQLTFNQHSGNEKRRVK